MKDIPMLTGLRGAAALLVFISHCANQGMLPGILGNGLGQIGVMLFFVLSGFLMSYLYLEKDFSRENVSRYISARVARVIPLYVFLLLLSYAISNSIYPDFHYSITDPVTLLRALLFIDAPFEFWTIPVEIQFYAVFIVFWFMYQSGISGRFLALFAGLTIIPSVLYFLVKDSVLVLFSTYSLAFFVGVLTARLQQAITTTGFSKTFSTYAPLPLMILFILNLPALRLEHGLVLGEGLFLRTWADPLNWLLVYGLFVCAVMNAPGLSFLNARVFAFYGKISYGFYLVHYPIIKIVKTTPVAAPLQFPLSLLIVTLLAYLSFHTLEKRFGAMIKDATWLHLDFYSNRAGYKRS